MLSLNKSPNDKTAGHVYGSLARLFRLLRNGRRTGRSHSLGPVAIADRFLAPMKNPTASQAAIGVAVHGKAVIEDHDALGLAVLFPHQDGTGLEAATSPTGAHPTQGLGGDARCTTLSDFRRIALSMPETEELNGMGYPNFRTGRKSFAAIEDTMAVIRLTRDQQAAFIVTAPEVFAPDSSGWGRLGSTVIRLEVADEATVQVAVATAWSNVAEVGHPSEVVDAADVENATEFVKVAEVVDARCTAEVADFNMCDAAEVNATVVKVVNAGKVANQIRTAAFVNAAGAVEVGDAAEVADEASSAALAVNVEPLDPLLSVIERLQMSWGDEIKKDPIQ
jgi:hypothetical protein